jgi:hypothetical protein
VKVCGEESANPSDIRLSITRIVRWPASSNAGRCRMASGASSLTGPPIESSDIQVTAASMRSLQLYAPRLEKADYQHAIRRAAEWLVTATPRGTEDRAFQLLGLGWSAAATETIQKAGRALAAEQRPDGGWAQIPTLNHLVAFTVHGTAAPPRCAPPGSDRRSPGPRWCAPPCARDRSRGR